MDLKIFEQNIKWNISQIISQNSQAQMLRGRAKSGFYKAAIIFASSVVEALVFNLLEKKGDTEMPLEEWNCIESNLLPQTYVIDGSRLSICKRGRQKFQLRKHTDFKKVNEICLKLNIFSHEFFEKIEKIRELRNKVHIQGLNHVDRSYTKRELEVISSVIDDLLVKLYIH